MCWRALTIPTAFARQEGQERLFCHAQRNDRATLQELVHRYERKVFSFLLTLLGDEEVADRAAVRVFADWYASRQRTSADSHPLAWLYRAALRESYTVLEQEERRKRAPRLPPKCQQILQQLAVLEEEERLLLLLREGEGYSIGDLADLFRTDASDLSARLLRARQRLQRSPLTPHVDATS